jgi:hypothetical protein
MRIWYAIAGTVTIRLTPEARRVIDQFNRLGRTIKADLKDHGDGPATVAFRGGDHCTLTAARGLDARVRELVPFVLVPAWLNVDCDGQRDEVLLGEPAPPAPVRITLVDGAEGVTGRLEVELVPEGSCLAIRPAGYGDADAADGFGAPVLLELHGGRLRLLVAPDINRPERQVLDLEGARLTNRT